MRPRVRLLVKLVRAHQHLVRAKFILASFLTALWISSAYALPNTGGGSGGDPPDCLGNITTQFTASPSNINLGKSSTLSWSVFVPTGCPVSSVRLDNLAVGRSGSQTVQPKIDTRYTLRGSGPQGTSLTFGSVVISVNLPGTVDILDSTPDWRGLLVRAVGKDNTTVRLAPDVDMDMSGRDTIYFGKGVTLVGGLPCADHAPATNAVMARAVVTTTGGVSLCGGRTAQQPGPRLYTTTRPTPLFTLSCSADTNADNVRISGFRLQGPHWDPMDGDENLERGIQIDSCINDEISGMELSGWSGQAIYVVDDKPGPREIKPDDVRIHDNFIHHNQHLGGDGYGVDVSEGAYALIEHNVFDFNRHAVTASGKAGTGYRASQNLVLKGGGIHGLAVGGSTGISNVYTQQFDVHGDHNCPNVWPFLHTWNCGQAGDQFWITANAFQYTNGYDFKIRGAPRIAAYVDANVFAFDNIDDAVHQNDSGMQVGSVTANTLGLDSYGTCGVCDFDGDGKDDLCLATGVSWWYNSSAKRQWVYLNAMPDRADRVGLGDFDGDHRCDVFAVHGNDWVISSAGTQPWRSLGSFGIPFDQLRFGDFNHDGIKDIFRRAPDGQWFIVSPGVFPMTAVQSSSLPLSQLRFGDFNHDGVTDVLAVQNGHWSVSWGARSGWQALNTGLSDDLTLVLIADLNGDGVDDVIRYVPDDALNGTWTVSWGGVTGWQTLAGVSSQNTEPRLRTTNRVVGLVGHFTNARASDLLSVDFIRMSQIFDKTTHAFIPYSPYAY